MYDIFKPRGEVKYLITKLNLKEYIHNIEEEKQRLIEAKAKLSDNRCNDGKRKTFDLDIEGLNKKIRQAEDIMKEDGEEIYLSGSMFIMIDPEVVYLSSGNYEKYMCYNSQYLIQWEMIQYAIEHHFKRYNFYGITGNFDKNDKDYGMYEFKTGFNGVVEELIGEYTYPTSFMYYIIKGIHKFRK